MYILFFFINSYLFIFIFVNPLLIYITLVKIDLV